MNVSSVHEEVAESGIGEYCSAKGLIKMLPPTFALELDRGGNNVFDIAQVMSFAI